MSIIKQEIFNQKITQISIEVEIYGKCNGK